MSPLRGEVRKVNADTFGASAAATVMVKVRVVRSPSPSVATQVCSLAALAACGVPLIVRLALV